MGHKMEAKLKALYEHLGFEFAPDPDDNHILVVNKDCTVLFVENEEDEDTPDQFLVLCPLAQASDDAQALHYLLTQNAQEHHGLVFAVQEETSVFLAQMPVHTDTSDEEFISAFMYYLERIKAVSTHLKSLEKDQKPTSTEHLTFAL